MDEISQADWERTPESVRQLLVKLLGSVLKPKAKTGWKQG
jgi:hypothetical protein